MRPVWSPLKPGDLALFAEPGQAHQPITRSKCRRPIASMRARKPSWSNELPTAGNPAEKDHDEPA
jgi:hypothetical protein